MCYPERDTHTEPQTLTACSCPYTMFTPDTMFLHHARPQGSDLTGTTGRGFSSRSEGYRQPSNVCSKTEDEQLDSEVWRINVGDSGAVPSIFIVLHFTSFKTHFSARSVSAQISQ